jgi:hypothetical protein
MRSCVREHVLQLLVHTHRGQRPQRVASRDTRCHGGWEGDVPSRWGSKCLCRLELKKVGAHINPVVRCTTTKAHSTLGPPLTGSLKGRQGRCTCDGITVMAVVETRRAALTHSVPLHVEIHLDRGRRGYPRYLTGRHYSWKSQHWRGLRGPIPGLDSGKGTKSILESREPTTAQKFEVYLVAGVLVEVTQKEAHQHLGGVSNQGGHSGSKPLTFAGL